MPPPITAGLLWSTDVAIDFAASGPIVPAIPMPRAAGPLYCVVSAQTAGSEGVIFRVGNPDDNFHEQNTFQAERWDGLYGLMAAPGWPNQVIGEAPAIGATANHLWEFWFSTAGTDFIDHQPFGLVNNDLPNQDVAASSHLFIGYRLNEGSPMDRATGTIHRMAVYDRIPDEGERALLATWVQGKVADGGTITTATIDGVECRIHTFTESGEFSVLEPLDVEYFLVGGGGCGWSQGSGNAFGGGGAGGRVIHNFGLPLTISPGAYPVTVGPGAPGGLSNTVAAKQGGDTVFAGITAHGGEMGQGTRGGNQRGDGGRAGGAGQGGGGAGDGEDGQNADGTGGKGGDGSYHNPDGNPRYFGPGGGGRTNNIPGAGGLGGGTSGSDTASGAGTDGLGSGTGSSRGSGLGTGKGGDGIVIIRYRLQQVDPPITMALAASDAPDSARITASVRWPAIAAILAAADAPDIASISATVPVRASLAAADAPDRAAIRATLGWPAIMAHIAASDARDTATMSLAVRIGAVLAAADVPDIARIIVGTGWPAIMARVAASDAPDQAAIQAAVPIRAGLAAGDAPDSARLSVAVRIGAVLDAADAPDMASIIMRLWSQSSRYAYPGDPQGGTLAPSIRSGTIQRP